MTYKLSADPRWHPTQLTSSLPHIAGYNRICRHEDFVSWIELNWYFIAVEYRHWRMCFELLLQEFARWQPGILFDIAAQPILEYTVELSVFIHNHPCKVQTQFKVATVYSIHTQSLFWCSTGLAPDVYTTPKGMKARVNLVQSIEPHRILGTQSGLELIIWP